MRTLCYKIIELAHLVGSTLLQHHHQLISTLGDFYPDNKKAITQLKQGFDWGIDSSLHLIHRHRNPQVVEMLKGKLLIWIQLHHQLSPTQAQELVYHFDMLVRIIYNLNLVNQRIDFSNATYHGSVFFNEPNGKGTLIFKDGLKYYGDFVNRQFSGKGVLITPNGMQYEGEFHQDHIQGKGKINWSNQHSFEGDFIEERPVGRGILHFPDGSQREGYFLDGIWVGINESLN